MRGRERCGAWAAVTVCAWLVLALVTAVALAGLWAMRD